MLVKPDIASVTEKHFAPFSCGKMSSKQGIGCLGTLIALLMVFDGSKQILNLSFVSLIVMLLHQAVGSYCRQIFPSLSILSNCSLILACLASGCWWIASWTGVTFGSKSKETGFPNCPNPVCTMYAQPYIALAFSHCSKFLATCSIVLNEMISFVGPYLVVLTSVSCC